MTTLPSNTDSQQPRYDAQSAFQAADHLEKQAEQLESGIPIDQHEAECRELEAIADGCETPDEVETMADKPAKESPLDQSLVQRAMRAFLEFTFPEPPKKSKYELLELEKQFAVNEILEAYETALKAGRKVTIAGFVRGVDDAIRDALIEELKAIAEYYRFLEDPIPESFKSEIEEINHHDLFHKIRRTSCTKAVRENRRGFFGAVIEIPIQTWFHPKSPRTTPPLLCDHLPLDLARMVAVEWNERSIRHCKRSWAVIIRRRPKLFGVIKLPYVVHSLQTELDANHPEIDFSFMKTSDADNEAARLNESILRVSRCPKRWHVVAVSTS